MTVRELIAKLLEFDQDLQVFRRDTSMYHLAVKVVEEHQRYDSPDKMVCVD